eukprot:917839_1
MGITRYIYQSRALHDWQTWTLVALNFTTLVITVINYVYLCKKMPIAHHPMPKSPNPQLKDITSAPLLRRQSSIQSMLLSGWRTRVIYYFYIMPAIPLLVSYVAHYGAQYPYHSIWIFPGLDIVVAIAFLSFMNMMIVSCDGMSVIRFYLEPREDNYLYKCCRKPNAWLGFISRFKWKYLIVMKPLVDYTLSYFEYFHGSAQFQQGVRVPLKVIIILCTALPVKGMQLFHKQCYKLSRMKRTHSKTNFVVCLAPGIQLQQLLIALWFSFEAVPGFENVKDRFRWCCFYGMLLCLEMVVFAAFVTFVFHPSDLLLWDDTDILLAGVSKHKLEDLDSRSAAGSLPMEQTDVKSAKK